MKTKKNKKKQDVDSITNVNEPVNVDMKDTK